METPVVEKKESKTAAIVGTVVAVLLCGCPGLALCLGGVLTAVGIMPWYGNIGDQYYDTLPTWFGYVFLCLSIILVAIPVVVGILTLRKKKPAGVAPVDVLPLQEPLPPAS